eukprot:gnl/Ergobibamus_cyprinoides/268.p1 GENE.gnl/Ergobibamus_cyprinoides/268~~gnl/Ergobibamus_cyprinoides/268.p1  ORF type:complete len:380 (+),score=88.75 gnl/Ergobibamus_cyprinoides/268:29-1141(+)
MTATGGGDDKAFIFTGEDGVQRAVLEGHSDSIVDIAFNFEGSLLATASLDGTVRVWRSRAPRGSDPEDTSFGTLACTLEGPDQGIEWVAWHPRGNVLLAGSEDGAAWLWGVTASGKSRLMTAFTGHSGPVSTGTWACNGKRIVTGSHDGSVRIWEPASPAALHTIKSFSSAGRFDPPAITSMAAGPVIEGAEALASLVLVGCEDGSVHLISADSGKVLHHLPAHSGGEPVEAVTFIPGAPLAASGSIDGSVQVYELGSGALRHRLQLPQTSAPVEEGEEPLSPAPAPLTQMEVVKGPVVAVTDANGGVHLLHVVTGGFIKSFDGHDATINALAVPPRIDAAPYIVTGDDAGEVLVFPLDAGNEQTVEGPQ